MLRQRPRVSDGLFAEQEASRSFARPMLWVPVWLALQEGIKTFQVETPAILVLPRAPLEKELQRFQHASVCQVSTLKSVSHQNLSAQYALWVLNVQA